MAKLKFPIVTIVTIPTSCLILHRIMHCVKPTFIEKWRSAGPFRKFCCSSGFVCGEYANPHIGREIWNLQGLLDKTSFRLFQVRGSRHSYGWFSCHKRMNESPIFNCATCGTMYCIEWDFKVKEHSMYSSSFGERKSTACDYKLI